MSTAGRGRGYTGRHHLREQRPGAPELTGGQDQDVVRTLAELSPRASDPAKAEMSKLETKMKEADRQKDMEIKEEKFGETLGEIRKQMSGEDEATLAELLTVDETYAPLLSMLEQFSPGEDGIIFNKKLKHFESMCTNLCPDETLLQAAFETFRAAALVNSVTARKLATVGASFTRQQRQQLFRSTLLNVVMQGTYSKLDVLERSNPSFLINAANLMGDYFAEARLCNGNKLHILASPLLHYMRALLASDDIRAHRSLATQLMQNGRELLSVLSDDLENLAIDIRMRLLSPPPVSTVWLLLSSDLCLNKFLPLPNSIQKFYAAHLNLNSDESYSEVSYGSWKKPEKDGYKSDSSELSMAEQVNQNLSQISLNHDEKDPSKPKLRPILGAGAGLLRQEQTSISVSQDNFDSWNVKNSLTKRYDLNSWRQADEEKKEETEPVFNPAVLPPNLQQYSVTVPDYPPPNVTPVNRYNNYQQDNYVNYLQQGDGTHVQNQYPTNTTFNSQGDFAPQFTPATAATDRQNQPERVNNEVQKTSNRRPIENWRKDKGDLKEDSNRNRPRNWNRQHSKDNINNDEDDKETNYKENDKFRSASRNSKDGRPGNRLNRRNSTENQTEPANAGKNQNRRNVTDVPRSQRYWDHDDRCDKDYSS